MLPLALSAVLLLSAQDPSILTIPSADFTATSTVAHYIKTEAGPWWQERALFIAEHESQFVFNQRGDMQLTCLNVKSPYYGQPVEARGIWQITKCYHPEVTDAQADDVVWSTAWAMTRLTSDKLCAQEWTQCRLYLQK